MQLPDDTRQSIGPSVAQALVEDVGAADLTAALIDADAVVGATILARESMVLAGQPWVDEVFAQLDESIIIDWYVGDGQTAEADDVICKLVGPARALMTGERTALNFLQTLSATATVTAAFVRAVAGTNASILGIRKTLPGLRLAQKYAVTCGGGQNHPVGLFDAIVLKDNHIKSAGGIAEALAKATDAGDDVPVGIEIGNHDDLIAALDAGAGRILLDNFSVEELRRAVATNGSYGYVSAELEASGNITLPNVRSVAETGVDFVSTGALTQNIRAADLTMLFRID